MEGRIGSDLRRARMRREIELAEVEASTRIRIRFLRAIEDEDWGALPGGVYTRGFIRTYASYLGLDGERLAEDYRGDVEGVRTGRDPAPELAPVAASTATGSPGGRRARPHPVWLAVPGVVLLAALAIAVLPDGSSDSEGPIRRVTQPSDAGAGADRTDGPSAPLTAKGISLRLTATAEVWVCLLDAGDQPLIAGQILEAGAEEGPFRSGSFTVSLGNGEVSMLIDGNKAEIPATPSPIGYSIDPLGGLTELGEAERPTCT
jgi:helix-turn-helix protein